MTRFYVTVTWDDWPEGGSYGTIVEAENDDIAKVMVFEEMARARADERTQDAGDVEPEDWQEILSSYADDWHVVDCFDLDEFIDRHAHAVRAALDTIKTQTDALEQKVDVLAERLGVPP